MRRAARTATWAIILLLIGITLVFAVLRVATDLPLLTTGRPAQPGTFEERYVAQPWLAYLHVVPGVLYLLAAPLQLWRPFRERHFTFHRRFGRLVLALGLTSGIFALGFGIPFSFGGAWQSLATTVFGSWFIVALLLAFRAIRGGNVRAHRRWMIRAFAVGLGVGTIRLWVGFFLGAGLLPFDQTFAPAFWLGLGMHVIAGEAWVRWRPEADGSRVVR